MCLWTVGMPLHWSYEQIMDWDKMFVCAVKSNVCFSPDQVNGERQNVANSPSKTLDWMEKPVTGFMDDLKGYPRKRLLKLFRIVVGSDKTEYIVITMQPSTYWWCGTIRWKIIFHREPKQLTGIECRQARKNDK